MIDFKVRIKFRNTFTMREHMYPEKYDVESFDPIPPPLEVLNLERYKAKGCDVVYREPDWIKEEKDKLAMLKDYEKLGSVLEEIKSIPRKKVKKEKLPKTYSFFQKGL